MKARKSAQRTAKQVAAIRCVGRHLQGGDQAVQQVLAEIQQLAATLAPGIILAGVLQGDDHVEALVKLKGKDQAYRALCAFADHLEAAGVDTRMPAPFMGDGNSENREPLVDVAFNFAMGWGEAGYRLGLAVGMRLGPSALTAQGGTR